MTFDGFGGRKWCASFHINTFFHIQCVYTVRISMTVLVCIFFPTFHQTLTCTHFLFLCCSFWQVWCWWISQRSTGRLILSWKKMWALHMFCTCIHATCIFLCNLIALKLRWTLSESLTLWTSCSVSFYQSATKCQFTVGHYTVSETLSAALPSPPTTITVAP